MAQNIKPIAQNINPMTIPTGYEDQLAAIARKRAVADALSAQALTPGKDYRSVAQPLAQIAEAFFSNRAGKQADEQSAALNTQRVTDAQGKIQQLVSALHAGPGNTPDYDKVTAISSDPVLANNPMVKQIVEAYGTHLKNDDEALGNVENFKDPVTGKNVSMQGFKSGRKAPIAGGFNLAPVMSNVNGVAIPLQDQAPGAVLPQNLGDRVIRDAKGNPVQNTPLVNADMAVAGAGKSTNNTFVNLPPIETKYAGKMGEALATTDATTLEAARAAPQVYAGAQEVINLVKGGKVFTGTAANARLTIAQAMKTAGLSNDPRVANTQSLVSQLANQTLAHVKSSGLGAGNGFTDTDRKYVEAAAGGNINLDADAITRLANLSQKAARISQKQGQAVFARMRANPAAASMTSGLENELNVPMGAPSGIKVRRIK